MLRTLPMIGLLLLAPLACDGPEPSSAAPPAVRVQVARAERREVTRSIRLPASVEAFEQARLYAKVAGYLGTINVDIGDHVQSDQLLAVLDIPEMQDEIAAAQAQLAERRAQFGKAEADAALQKTLFERARALRERKAVTQTDLDEAQAKHAIARAALQLAAAQVKSAEANLAKLHTLAEYARIKAPFDGIVTERFVDPGALIQAATGSANVSPIVTVARIDRVRTFVDIPEREVPFISTSNTATLVPSAFTDQTFAGHVTRFAGALNPATRTMRTEVDFDNPEGRLYPGMYGNLTLALDIHPEALTLPSAAVTTQKDGKSFVYVVTDGTAHQKSVRVGVDDGVRAEIISGLDGTEACIVAASGSITEGGAVQVTDTGSARAGS
jgi:RND family efflux transporter MFP subunit